MIHAMHAVFLASIIAGRGPIPLDGATPGGSAATALDSIVAGWGTASGATCDPDEGTTSACPRTSVATVGPRPVASGFVREPADTIRPRSARPRAIEYSDWYYRRLTMHRIASYAELPLFAGEYFLGEQLLHDQRHGTQPSGLVTAHVLVATGLGALFAFNTVTGGWNLWESRKDPAGRTRRMLHTVLMLAADAGFFATAAVGGNAKNNISNAELHRNVAVASMGVGFVGTAMMWVWRN
jgi:hypothetical protein